jgi:general secretion pathway protein A
MYTRYFGFNEKPFTLTPNPRFIFLGKHHKEAFAHLLYGINNHYGFIELIGEVGTGKTTVLRTLLGQLQEENYRCALIFNPCMTAVELLRSISQEFGIDAESDCINDLVSGLNRYLLVENNHGRTVVLVIDEAQTLHADVLEQVRLISNLETENDKLIQIILAGQPELETILQRHDLRQLNQRIAVRYRLRSMDRDETRRYLRHRMEIAGATGGVTFSRLAIYLIHIYSRGIPRMVNILCDRALLIAYGNECRKVSSVVVIQAIRELFGIPLRRFARAGLIALVMITLFALAGISRFPQWQLLQQFRLSSVASPYVLNRDTKPIPAVTLPMDATSALKSQAGPPAGVPRQDRQLDRELTGIDLNDAHIHAFNALMSSWNVQPIKIFKGTLMTPDTFRRLAAKRNLRCTAFKGSLDDAIRFGLPFLATTRVLGKSGYYCLAVTSATNTSMSVSPALFGNGVIQKSELAGVANGTFYLFWRNFGKIPDTIYPGEKRYELRILQQLLKQAGFFQDTVNGDYNSATSKAVREFQRSWGIVDNDTVGELTLAVLSRFDTLHATPTLKGN